MNQNSIISFLKTLERFRGTELNQKKLLAEVRSKKPVRPKGRGRGAGRHGSSDSFDPEAILLELEMLGLIKREGRKRRVKKPFTLSGRVSMSPRGMIFVMIQGAASDARDIFVPPAASLGAMAGDHVELRLKDRKRDRFEGEIVRILKRSRREYRLKLLSGFKKDGVAGVVLDTPGNITAYILGHTIPEKARRSLKQDAIVIVTLLGREIRYMGGFFQEAEYLRRPVPGDAPDADMERILLKYGLEREYPFEPELGKLKTEPSEKNVKDWKERKDLRELPTITIDGATSKDFDDAISLVPVKSSVWKLYVHIADVGHYVLPGTPLDEEARERSTSVYLADRVVPMLPPELSENLCSLIANKNRLAFTAEMDISLKHGRIVKSSFYKSVIKVDRRLNYDIAEEEIEAEEKKPEKKLSMLGLMWRLAQVQRESRRKSGRVDLSIPEPKLLFGPGNSLVGVEYKPRLRSSILIEEFMLSANIAVAEFLRKKKANVLYRIHESMDELKLERLNSFLEIYNVKASLKDVSYKSISKALAAVAEHPQAATVDRIFNIQLLRSFMQAKYNGKPLGHWGLGFPDYCHFTSPIRRYPDLVVHRALHRILKKKKQVYTPEDIEELGYWTSDQERRAMEAERDILKLKMIRHILESGRKKFTGYIIGIKHDRVFMELDDIPAEGAVAMRHLTNDSELIMPNDFSVYVKRLSRPAFMGERWGLELEEANMEQMTLFFKPIWKEVQSPFISGNRSRRR